MIDDPNAKVWAWKIFLAIAEVAAALADMIARQRITQTLLFSGPEGVGKATLARRFAALLLRLTLPKSSRTISAWNPTPPSSPTAKNGPSEKRNEDPLFFSSHPDFLTFAPDGPLRQITIPQMRLLKDRAPLKPLKGAWRVFLIDSIDRANEQAANSLLKTLEEPPPHLILIMTARNPYDLLPTIRSRAVPFRLSRLDATRKCARSSDSRGLDQPERRRTLAEGSPGLAVSLDLEAYDRRRAAMLALLKVASGMRAVRGLAEAFRFASRRAAPRSWIRIWKFCTCCSRTFCGWPTASRSIRNEDIRVELEALAAARFLRLAARRRGKSRRADGAGPPQYSEIDRLDALAVELRSR